MKDLVAQMKTTIVAGLRRRNLTRCSKWAEKCIIMGGSFPGPMKFLHYPWLKEMHDSQAEWNVGQKAAQMGYSVTVMNVTFFQIDIHRRSVLYLLPTKVPDAMDFSATRFDPLLELSPHLAELFSDVKNVGTKRAGSACMYIRGSNSRASLKSIPVSVIVFDEYEEMNQGNIPLALERTSGQLYKQFWAISTPSIPDHGINKLFNKSTMEHFMFDCPSCSRKIEFRYPDSLVVTADSLTDSSLKDSYLICTECKATLPHEDKSHFLKNGIWVPTGHKDMSNRGFYINQMYSPTIEPWRIAEKVLLAKISGPDEQELYNSKLGLPHIVAGGRIDDGLIDSAISKSRRVMSDTAPRDTKFIGMGVDVGPKRIHYEITAFFPRRIGADINEMSDAEVLNVGVVHEFEELDRLMRHWQVLFCVIDQMPERRKAYEFACRFPGHVRICWFGTGKNGKTMKIEHAGEEHRVTVDRTTWLDIALGRFHNGTISLPKNTPDEYRQNLKSPVRIYKMDQYGNPHADYISTTATGEEDSKNARDHFALARTYCEMTLPFMASLGTKNKNIEAFL